MSNLDDSDHDTHPSLNAMSIHAITTHDDDINNNHHQHDSSSRPNPIDQQDGFQLDTHGDKSPSWDSTEAFRRYSSAAESNQEDSPVSTSSATPAHGAPPRYAQDIPLSLSERRQRNKAASAKYRAKKHAVTMHMSTEIEELTKSNTTLKSKLEDAQRDNEQLRKRCAELEIQLTGSLHSTHHEGGEPTNDYKRHKNSGSPQRSKSISKGKSKKLA
ncbi:hypothetical protein INT43_001517 [Umbelopsis isabellina]|uniref:BZIP domain-containing protein n=1 Tax=Mortierella isabellina TaxID=91625 RepID=A0A8H7U7S1_MORIS|nr:hypothetical protein INT43_001517 [Umbelopsis isabellina]